MRVSQHGVMVRGWRKDEHGAWLPDPTKDVQVAVELLVDEEALVKKLGPRAAQAKGRKAIEAGGAVTVRVVGTVPATK